MNKISIWLLVLLALLISVSLFLILRNNNETTKEQEYNDLVNKLCKITLDLSKSYPEVISIDKNKSIKYVSFDALAGLTLGTKNEVPRYIINPKESSSKSIYFSDTTRIKLRINNNKIICEGLVDIGNPPVIVLIKGDITISKGSIYNDPGVYAFDTEDGNLTSKVITKGEIDTSIIGSYTLLYYVEDSIGNVTSKIRNVTVK